MDYSLLFAIERNPDFDKFSGKSKSNMSGAESSEN